MADLKAPSGDLYEECRNALPGLSVEQTKQIEAAIKAGNFSGAASVVQKFNFSDSEFNIAIMGKSGSGRSSLVNAILGLGEEDEGAAEAGVLEVTKEPVPYWHPTCPTVIVWDLPAVGSPVFQPSTYLKQVKFSCYDVFIIIASERRRNCHSALAQEIHRLGKKCYFVRSKVDLDLYNEKHKRRFNEEKILRKIREDCVKNLRKEGMSSPQVFLVSSREFQKYDSPQLQKTLLKELYSHKTEMVGTTEASGSSGVAEHSKSHWANLFLKWGSKLPGLAEEETQEFQKAAKTGNLSKALAVVKKSDELLRNTKLNIAVTGNAGTGKSSFVNAIRGLTDNDKSAAWTGTMDATKKPIPYDHPTHPNVIVWDLPGIGTPDHPAETYLKDVNFDQYDFFIIMVGGRVTELDIMLAKEIQRSRKKFYFIRSKVDIDLVNQKEKLNFSEQETLQKIRDNCLEMLNKLNVSTPRIFIVSSRHFDKYDSPQLQEALANDLDTHKRHILLCALPSTSEEILIEKLKTLQEQIWKQALKSCTIAAVPVPGLLVRCEVNILVENMAEYCKAFGLDDDSLSSLAKQAGKSVHELKSVIQSAMVKDVTREEARRRLKEATGKRMTAAKYLIIVVPLIGTGIMAKRSYNITYEMLQTFLDEVVQDAQRVLRKAFGGAERIQ
nr:interferon-inducible GTPase 5-like [Pelodiscus sinensis]|eukprot:XP_014435348.1 interferon-inducible GTPase 5-like [Pelodiscus sinensis]